MARVQERSAPDPELPAGTLPDAVEALKLAEAMGLVPPGEGERPLCLSDLRKVARAAAREGIGSVAAARLTAVRVPGPSDLRRALASLRVALEGSPAPRTELPALAELLGPDMLAGLVGVSVVSLRRYLAGSRTTPDGVAGRLHFLAVVAGDLLGAYNEVGVRRWFERKRTALGGRAPAEILSGEWDPDDERPSRVRALARSLLDASAT